MSEQIEVEKKKNLPPRGERGGRKPGHRFPKEVRLKAVRMILEEGFKPDLVCEEIGACKSIVAKWVAKYHQHGEAGLQSGYGTKREPKLPEPITEKIIELKKENPTFGIKRISQILRRLFFLPASPETVRQRLHEAELMPESSPPKKRNVTRPRFFERATPNQMWQTDIFTFRLGGRYAYLIAFMDQPTGRPKIPKDPEKLALQRRIKQLELQVEHQQEKARLRQLLDRWTTKDKRPPAKKNLK